MTQATPTTGETAATGGRPTRAEQREAMFAEIVRVSQQLIGEGGELSLRALAARMGITAPALYRYVENYQELVDLVAYEIDRTATERFAAAADALPVDDAAGRLAVAATEFRMWALENPGEFAVVFANPVADSSCIRRELVTTACSGHLMTGLIYDIHQQNHFSIPALDDLPEPIRETLLEPLIPADIDRIPREERGLVWVYMQGWTQLYGVVALEVMGHMDPRVIESGEMFLDVLLGFAPRLGLADDLPRLAALVRERVARR